MGIGWQILANGLIAGSIYALVALGFNLIYGVQRFFHLAHGVTAVASGYLLLFLLQGTDWPLWLCLVLTVLGGALIGVLMERAVFWPIRKQKGSSLIMVVASLGLVFIGQALITILFSPEYQSYPRALWDGIFEFGNVIITRTQVLSIATSIIAFGAVKAFLRYTTYGQAIRAVSDDIHVASLIGIRVERVIVIAFLIASVCAALAGIFVGFDTGLQPGIGLNIVLKGAVAGVIGGLGTVEGAFLGGFFLGIIENLGIWHVPSEWKDPIAFGLLILFLLFRPTGIIKRRG